MKYSKIAAVVRYSGGTIALGEGMSIEEDHPLYIERPDIFGDEPPGADIKTPAILKKKRLTEDADVEKGTRAPGEKRTTSRQRS